MVDVAVVSGGFTALEGLGVWISGSGSRVVEQVTLLLVSGASRGIEKVVDIVRNHLAKCGEEALYVLDIGSARIELLQDVGKRTKERVR